MSDDIKDLYAVRVREATDDGEELLQFALSIFRSDQYTDVARWKAFEWLSDRAYGKVGTSSMIPVKAESFDFEKLDELSDDELDALYTMMKK